MSARPTLFLTVGLPGTGKTTAARRIEAEGDALRLTKDEWMKALYGPDNPSAGSDVPTPGELDGSEPVDDPPGGFGTWDDWRAHRWPPSVS